MASLRTHLVARAAVVGWALLLAPLALAPALLAQEHGGRSGREIYLQACAACHGVDGRGVAQPTVGFDLPLPDFTDCSFVTREPRADWHGITHDGGPARAFSPLMPAFGDALTAEEIAASLDHIKGFCESRAWPQGELNFPRAIATEKAFPEDEAVITSSITAEGERAISNKLIYEKRVGPRSQIEVIVPFSATSGQAGDWAGGIGDLAVGAKSSVYHNYGTGTIFSVAGEVILPTGDADRGFGKGVTVLEPFAAFGQVLPRDSFLQIQTGMEIPTDSTKGAKEAFWRMAIGKTFTQGRLGFGRAWSPIVEFVGVRELVSGERVQWDVLPQMQVTLSTRQHIMASFGVRVPLTDRKPRQTQFVTYLLWDWFDGPLLGGW